MASQKHKKTHTGDDLPSTAATNRFSGRVAIFVTGGASGVPVARLGMPVPGSGSLQLPAEHMYKGNLTSYMNA